MKYSTDYELIIRFYYENISCKFFNIIMTSMLIGVTRESEFSRY